MRLIELDNKARLSWDEYLGFIGEPATLFESESAYQHWLGENVGALAEVMGIEIVSPVRVNKVFYGTNLRPDFVFMYDRVLNIVEVKNTRVKHASQGMTQQIAAISQLLLYEAVAALPCKLFLVDTCIHKLTAGVVLRNKLPISLIQARPEHFVLLNGCENTAKATVG